jgi:acyl carrier protein
MSEQENRLLNCFASVFPGLSYEDIRNSNAESIGAWDSLSSVTLAALIQEEFNLEIDPEVLPQLDSFETFRAYLQQEKPAGE